MKKLLLIALAFAFCNLGFAQSNGGKKKEPKKYTDIITDKANTSEGLIITHEVDGSNYFEIPDSIFGRDILAITRIAKAPTGAGYGGEQANEQV